MKIKNEDGDGGGAPPSNAVNTGQVDMTPTKRFDDLYRRTKRQRKQMDEYYIDLFREIMLKGK